MAVLLPRRSSPHTHHTVDGACGFRQISQDYRGALLTRKHPPLGPYRKPLPRVLGEVLGGWEFSYERGAPVLGLMPRVLGGFCTVGLCLGS